MEPAVNGTKNVIIAGAEAKVRRVVFTSSIGAVYMDPNRSMDVVVDESCWSDLEYCKNTKVILPHPPTTVMPIISLLVQHSVQQLSHFIVYNTLVPLILFLRKHSS